MTAPEANVIVCGAGIAGIAAAYRLSLRADVGPIVLLERDAPLSLTSDKSTECYRNWWQGPGDDMVAFANHSIDLLEALARDSDDAFSFDRRGYLFVTANPACADRLAEVAQASESLGTGALRVHNGSDERYRPGRARGFDDQPIGSDLLRGRDLIQRLFPYVSDDACAALHVRRAGTLSAQQLGMLMLERARERGVTLMRGELVSVRIQAGAVSGAVIATANGTLELNCRALVNAAGPHLQSVAEMVGLDLPVACERHAKLSFSDREGVFPRDAPLSIWCDDTTLPWDPDEAAALSESAETAPLTEPFPAGVHGRPIGAGDTVMLYWTYDCPLEKPQFPITWDPHYPEILMRGMSVMMPGLAAYYQHIPKAYVDGGYYTKTRENRPLIGPTPVPGFHLMGGFSGFGIMTSLAGGDLLADHLTGSTLPHYAAALSLERYDNPEYQELLDNWPASGQI